MPGRYLVALIAVLLCLFIVLFGMQFPKSRIFILEIVLSILIDAVPGLGAYYVGRTSHLLDNIGGTVYKADNMIAVVRADAADTGRKVAQRVGKGGKKHVCRFYYGNGVRGSGRNRWDYHFCKEKSAKKPYYSGRTLIRRIHILL